MLKNCYVNYAPRRIATVTESCGTGQVHVEKFLNGEVIEVLYLGEGRNALNEAREKGLNWARHGDPNIEAQYTS